MHSNFCISMCGCGDLWVIQMCAPPLSFLHVTLTISTTLAAGVWHANASVGSHIKFYCVFGFHLFILFILHFYVTKLVFICSRSPLKTQLILRHMIKKKRVTLYSFATAPEKIKNKNKNESRLKARMIHPAPPPLRLNNVRCEPAFCH